MNEKNFEKKTNKNCGNHRERGEKKLQSIIFYPKLFNPIKIYCSVVEFING